MSDLIYPEVFYMDFLLNFKKNDDRTYIKIIEEQIQHNTIELLIDFNDLNKYNNNFSKNVLNNPEEHLKQLELTIYNYLYDKYHNIINNQIRIKIKIDNLKKLYLQDIKAENINKLICVEGIITSISQVRPMIEKTTLVCNICKRQITFIPNNIYFNPIKLCPICREKSLRIEYNKSIFIDALLLIISNNKRKIRVLIKGNNIKNYKLRDKIKLIGIVKIINNDRKRLNKYDIMIEENHSYKI